MTRAASFAAAVVRVAAVARAAAIARVTAHAAIAIAITGAIAACAGSQPPPAQPNVAADVRAAEAAERARQHDVARTRYEQAVADAHDPQSAGFAQFRFGETLATWGEYAEAQRRLEAATAATPNEPSAWYDLGIVREHAGDSRGALAALDQAKALAISDWRPRVALAALHWKLAGACFHATTDDATCAPEVAAATAEYRGLLDLDLPQRLRDKVEWALGELAKPRAGVVPSAAAPAPAS